MARHEVKGESAAADVEPTWMVTFTLRLPELLRDRLQEAAVEQGISINTYLIPCS